MNKEMTKYVGLIRENLSENYKGMFREAGGALEYPFLTPGSDQYTDVLWDWDSWLTNIALRQILKEFGNNDDREQAERVVAEHYRNEKTFNAPAGVRTLSKMEKMYNVRASGGPSSWLSPIWGVSNYLTLRGLLRYGFEDDARELAEKTVRLFGRDIERFGAMREYYSPENGETILKRGFQNWNFLVLNIISWLEGKDPVSEF